MPLLLVGMMRPAPQRDDLLAPQRAARDAARLQLVGLTEAEVSDLVATLVGGRPDGNLLRLAGGAAGNPLYVTELVPRWPGAPVSPLPRRAPPSWPAVPRQAPRRRPSRTALGSWPDRCARYCGRAALLGADFGVADLAIVLGRSVADRGMCCRRASRVRPRPGVPASADPGGGVRRDVDARALRLTSRSGARLDGGRRVAERVARQMLRAVGEPGRRTAPMDEWMLDWLARTADPLVAYALGVAPKHLTRAVASSSPTRPRMPDSPMLSTASMTGPRPSKWRTALAHATEPDLLVDLHWMLAQCRMLAVLSAESPGHTGPDASFARDPGPAPR
jgi:hypothetical protein